jgi:transposase-like protein
VFTLVARGSDQQCVIPGKSADESTVRLPLDDHEEESLTNYTDGFRAYDPLEDAEKSSAKRSFTETVSTSIEMHTPTPARATCRWFDGGSRPIEVSQKTN